MPFDVTFEAKIPLTVTEGGAWLVGRASSARFISARNASCEAVACDAGGSVTACDSASSFESAGRPSSSGRMPCWAATSAGVRFHLSTAVVDAPASKRRPTHALLPAVAATCSGVSPHSLQRSMGMWSIRSRIAEDVPAEAAICKALMPWALVANLSNATFESSTSTHLTSSDAQAQCNAGIRVCSSHEFGDSPPESKSSKSSSASPRCAAATTFADDDDIIL